jgi:hypothetical protein
MSPALLLVMALQAAPFPGAVQPDPVGNPTQWVPCSHPIAVARGLGCAPTPDAPPDPCVNVNPYTNPEEALRCVNRPPVKPFKLGRVYTRYDGAAAGHTRLFIAAAGQSPEGVPLLFSICLEVGGSCLFRGEVKPLLAHAEAQGWTEEAPQ